MRTGAGSLPVPKNAGWFGAAPDTPDKLPRWLAFAQDGVLPPWPWAERPRRVWSGILNQMKKAAFALKTNAALFLAADRKTIALRCNYKLRFECNLFASPKGEYKSAVIRRKEFHHRRH